jgi:hypothetical protein
LILMEIEVNFFGDRNAESRLPEHFPINRCP